MLKRLAAILLLRCSHCLTEGVFSAVFQMRPTCPVCHIKHEREEGFFMMAVFIGYCIYFVLLIPLSVYLYFRQIPTWQFVGIITVASVLLIFPTFHYARVIWLHVDEVLDPRPNL